MSMTTTAANYYTRASFFASGDSITMMCWFMSTALPASAGYENLVCAGPFGGGIGIGLDIHNVSGVTHLSMGTSASDFDGTTALSANTWYHGAGIRNGNTKTCYLNGAQDGTGSDTDTLNTAVGIGSDTSNASNLTGRLAAVKIWKAVLSLAEIQQEMRQYLPIRTTNLVGFYPLHSASDDEIDFSGNAATLTVNGTPVIGADNPPIPWRRGRYGLVVPAAALATSRRIIPAYQIPRRFEQSFLE